jgi:hypothetical protein
MLPLPLTRKRSSKEELYPDGLLPVRCLPSSGQQAVLQDDFIEPLATLDAAQRRHLSFNGQAELLISGQEPAASPAGTHPKKHAIPPMIVRFFSVRVS